MSRINPQRTMFIPRISSTTEDSTHLSYTISITGEQAILYETERPGEGAGTGSVGATVLFESFIGGITRLIDEYKKPLHLREDISAEEWKRSLTYSENEVRQILVRILEDFEIDTNVENIEWLTTTLGQLITFYETRYRVHLIPENRSMLNNLIVKMVHDRLCIKGLIK